MSRYGLVSAGSAALLLIGGGLDGHAAPTIDAICEAITRQRAAISALRLEYESKITADAEVDKAGLLNDTYVEERVTFAFRGPQRFLDFDGVDKRAGVRSTSRYTCVYTGSECRKRDSGILYIQKPKASYTETSVFFSGMRWPFAEAELESVATGENTFYLPDCLKRGDWHVREERDAQHRLLVVVSNAEQTQTLTFDPQRNFTLLHFVYKNPEVGVASWTNTLGKWKTIQPGVFLPTLLEVVNEHVDPKTGRAVGRSYVRVDVKKLTIDVPESLFKLEPRPGEAVIDGIHRTSYVYAPVSDHMLEDGARRGKIMMDVINSTQSVSYGTMLWIPLIASVLVLQTLAMRAWAAWRA